MGSTPAFVGVAATVTLKLESGSRRQASPFWLKLTDDYSCASNLLLRDVWQHIRSIKGLILRPLPPLNFPYILFLHNFDSSSLSIPRS